MYNYPCVNMFRVSSYGGINWNNMNNVNDVRRVFLNLLFGRLNKKALGYKINLRES